MEHDNGRPIFSEDSDGKLIAMRPSSPTNEDELQRLIASYPEIVSDGEKLLLIQREKGLPDKEGGGDRWSLDHLFVTDSGTPVLLEVKRAADTRIRREVIGQLMDYAANAVAYWPAGHLQEAFLATCRENNDDPDTILDGFLGGKDTNHFWTSVDENLSAGRLQLVIAADKIPAELARIIEFLNEQMKCDVKAVELRYFEAADGRRTLVPHIIGETEKIKAEKSGGRKERLPPITENDWLKKYIQPLGQQVFAGTVANAEIAKQLGGSIHVASSQGSLMSRFVADDEKEIWPWSMKQNGTIWIGFGWIKNRPALIDESIRLRFLKEFSDAVGGLTTNSITGSPAFPVERLNDGELKKRFIGVMSEFVKLAKIA